MVRVLKKITAILLIIIFITSSLPINILEQLDGAFESNAITDTWTYNYIGGTTTWTAPYTGYYQIDCYGAQGGQGDYDGKTGSNPAGNNGTYRASIAKIQKDTTLTIVVGNKPTTGSSGFGEGSTNGESWSTSVIQTTNGYETGRKQTVYWKNSSHSCGSHTQYRGYPNGGYGGTKETICDSDGNHSGGASGGGGGGSSYIIANGTTIISAQGGNGGSASYVCLNNDGSGTVSGGSGGGSTTIANATGVTWNTSLLNTTTSGARSGNGYISITLVGVYPEVSIGASTTALTAGNVTLTANVTTNDVALQSSPYSWNGGARTTSKTYTATKNGNYTVNVINTDGNATDASITVSNIDKIKPVVNSINKTISSDYTKATLEVSATDSSSTEYVASGVASYALTKTNTTPTTFQASNTFTVTENGIYYAWAKDKVGNISLAKEIKVEELQIEILGNITWNDQNNGYNTRKQTTLNLYQKVGTGVETLVESKTLSAGQTSYSFKTREKDDNGNTYTFRVEQVKIDGYETIYSSNNITNTTTQDITINITNNLILPEYTSKIEYNLKDAFRGEYLKNTKVEMVATVLASSTNRDKVGLNGSKVTYLIDEGFTIDKNNIKVIYTDGTTGKETVIDDYTLQKNNLTINYGVGTNHVTKAGDKLTITINGVFNQIKSYNNSITLTGKLTDYRGTNTSIDLGEVTKTEKNYEVKYQKPQARIQMKKRDAITEESLSDATFTLYEWNGSQYVEKEILTDDDKDGIYTSNYYEWTSTTEGKYRIVETGVPLNHKDLKFSMEYTIDQLKEENYTITPDYDNGAYRIAYAVRNPDDFDRTNGIVENEPFKVKVSIDNRDSETKQPIQSNATYTIYEWDKTAGKYVEYISKTNSNKVEMTRGEAKIYTSNQWLYYTKNNEGKYKIVETTSAYGYYGDYTEEGNKREYEINMIDVIKEGAYGGQTIENESTIRLFNNKERTAIENKRVETKVRIQLIDSETRTNQIQASGSLAGVEYGIYAREQINHADGVTTNYQGEKGVLYKKDELVKNVSTNEEGNIEINDLECGKYYVKQKTAPIGYLADENIYEVDLSYQGQEKKIIEVNQTYENQIKKQSFQILKQQNIGNNEVAALANAGFSIYEIKELSIVKEGKVTKNTDGTYTLKDTKAKTDSRITKKANNNGTYNIQDLVDYYYKITYTEENMQQLPQGEKAYYPYNLRGENLVKSYENNQEGSTIEEMVTKENGYLKSPELAYGEYVVVETSVPHNKEAVAPIIIKITNDSRQSQNLRYIVDPDFEAKIKIYTKDIETRNTILKENAQFIIKNTDTGELMTYRGWNLLEGTVEYGTNENPYETTRKGYLVTPMNLSVGNYELIQLQAPVGYVLNGYEGYSYHGEIIDEPQTRVNFQIATNQMYFVDNELESNIIVTIQENKAQVGTLKVMLTGEKLIGVDKHENNQEPYTFQYEKQKLEGVEIGLYAKENIDTQDEQKTLIYEKDELVQRMTTNEEGIINFDNIPIGNYYVKEISTIEGFALNQETKDISISYGTNEIEMEAQKTPVTKQEIQKEDQRQKVSITLKNKDTQTGEPIQGTIIGLYAKENILNKDGIVIVSKDELIETKTTNEEGKIQITSDLPLGTYYAKEIQTATGYIENVTIVDIDVTYQLDGRESIVIEKEMQNEKNSIYVKPVDEQNNLIAGSQLQMIDESGNIVEEWTSTEETKQIQKLEVGKNYTLKQKEPMEGYVTIQEIKFSIQANGNLTQQVSNEQNTLKPVHYTSKLEIHLVDKDTKEEMQGIQFEIYNQAGEKVQEFALEENGYNIEKLPIGEYALRQVSGQEENLQNKGYAKLEDISFQVQDTKEIQKLIAEQDYTKLEIELIDKDTKEKIPGVNFEIYQPEATKDEQGNEIIQIEEKVREFTTGEENYITTRLPVGTYILKQVSGQEDLYNKGYVTNEDIEIKVEDKTESQKTTIEQQESKLEIEIIDKQNKEKTVGTIIEIIDNKTGKVVKEFTIKQEENFVMSKLPLGEYTLHNKEVDYTKGYIRLEDTIIQITDTIKTQKEILEQDYTKIAISLLDKNTKEAIIGGTLSIIDKEGKEVTESWISDGKKKPILKLPVGEYYLEETSAPTLKGYVRTKKIAFKVEETKEIQEVEMLQDYTQVKLQLMDEVTKEAITGAKLVVKDEKGNEITNITITEDETQNILTKLAVGTYLVESKEMPYGYKPIHTTITIKDKQGIQDNEIEVAREEFDLFVEAWIQEIKRNGKTEYTNEKQEQTVKKVDIKDKKIKTEQIQITYKIKISNPGKITGQVGKIEVSIPNGLNYLQNDNKKYWKQEDGKIVTRGLEGRDLKSGDYAEVELILRWKNGLENFGTKQIQASILETKSDNGFKETNEENNKARTKEIIIGVSTGEMNLVYACWILLAILIVLEIVISRKTKIKKFGLKDKTLQYKK